MRPLNRPEPLMAPAAYNTFTVSAPIATHWRVATCAEVECEYWERGWQAVVDVKERPKVAEAFRRNWPRCTYVEKPGTSLVVFRFPPGSLCHPERRPHYVPLERPEVFAVRRGWHERAVSEARILRPEDFVDALGTNLARLDDQARRG